MGSMAGRPSTVRARELGSELRERRERAKLSGMDLARRLGWSASKVSRMETGTRAVTEVDVAVYLSNCGVKRAELERLLELARGDDDGYWLSPNLRSLIMQENIARAITSFEPMVVPGLLQTEDYARALFRWTESVPADRVETLVSTRMARQGLLARYSPPQFLFYVHEHALRTTVGGAAVMHEQILRLLFADSRPQSPVRIVPTSAGPCGSVGGPFIVLDYEDHPSVAYVPLHTTSVFLEQPKDLESYRWILARLSNLCLDEGQSREFLAQLASDYDRVEEAPDDRPRASRNDLAEE